MAHFQLLVPPLPILVWPPARSNTTSTSSTYSLTPFSSSLVARCAIAAPSANNGRLLSAGLLRFPPGTSGLLRAAPEAPSSFPERRQDSREKFGPPWMEENRPPGYKTQFLTSGQSPSGLPSSRVRAAPFFVPAIAATKKGAAPTERNGFR